MYPPAEWEPPKPLPPLSTWQSAQAFGNVAECTQVQLQVMKSGQAMTEAHRRGTPEWKTGFQNKFVQCIASDDPRLAGKPGK